MKMKIPSGSSISNGYYNHDVNLLSYLSDHSDDASEEADSPTLDGDFSEYLWMENEEEFDQQVMKELEEEALMEECIEAMLEEEEEREGLNNTPSSTLPSVPNCPAWSTEDSNSTSLIQSMGSLRVTDELAKQSTLNPNATEFVPRPRATPAAPIEGKV